VYKILKRIYLIFKLIGLVIFVLVVTLLITVFTGCQSPQYSLSNSLSKEISVFAGSSSKAALDAAKINFKIKTGINVNLTYGGSGAILSQMELSKSGDLFIPASPDYITKAIQDNVIYPETETRLYYLVPAILVQKGNPLNIVTLSDLAKTGTRIAIADPKTVPAGLYAYEIMVCNNVLTSVGVNVVTYGDSNDKVSSYVILKSVDAAIAWDNIGLQQDNKLDVVYLGPSQIPRLSYMSGALSAFSKDRESALSFLNYLVSNDGQAYFKQFHYYTTESEARKFAPDAKIGGVYSLPTNYVPLVK
jgi:molybdate transport system substrate-binding protein